MAIGDTVTVQGVTGKIIRESDLVVTIEREARGASEVFTYMKAGVVITPWEAEASAVADVLDALPNFDEEPQATTDDDDPAPLVETADVEPTIAPPVKAAPAKAAPVKADR